MNITIIMPSRKRPHLARMARQAWLDHAKNPDSIKVLVLEDRDAASLLPSESEIVDRQPLLPCYYNLGAKMHPADAYICTGDDMLVTTPDYDAVIAEALSAYPDGIVLGRLTDHSEGHSNTLAAYPVVTEKWRATTGVIFPEIFPFWFTDLWLTQIADALKRKIDINVTLVDAESRKNRTQRMRDLAFWSWVYARTYGYRKDDCEALARKAGIDPLTVMVRSYSPLRPDIAMELELEYASSEEPPAGYRDEVLKALQMLRDLDG